jgi:hypothetical protein
VLKTKFSLLVVVTENIECVDIVPPQDAKIQSDQSIWDNQRISNDDTASEISINHEKNY